MTRTFPLALLAALCAAAAGAQPPPIPPAGETPPAPKAAQPKAVAAGPKFPAFPPAPRPVPPAPTPQPRPNADDPVKLGPGRYYVVASGKPLLVLPHGPGAVTVQERKPPFMLPAADAIGWPADKADPDFVTFTDPFLYVVKAKTSGAVTLTVIPALNDTDAAGKQVPLKAGDIARKPLLVDDGTGPQPPPIPPTPDPPVDPLVKSLAAGYALDAEPNKAQLAASLADVLGGAVAAAKASGRVATAKQLQDGIHAASDLAVGAGKLMNVRRAVGAYLTPKLGAADRPLTPALWDKAAAEYAAVAKALRGVK